MASPIKHYVARWAITGEQGAAGERFAADYEAAQRWLETHDAADREAAERCRRVLRELGDLRHVLVAVVGRKRWASEWAKRDGRPEGDGIVLPRVALDCVARCHASGRDAA
jgi:hypothetical protein